MKKADPRPPTPKNSKPPGAETAVNLAAYGIVFIALALAAIIRGRVLEMPLERDEGEFGYVAQLIMDGESPFHAYNFKLPGVSVLYALSMLAFGNSGRGIHLGLILVNSATILVLFLLVRRHANPITAGIAAFFYAIMSVDTALLGMAAHSEHFVNLFALLGFLLLSKATESDQKWYLFLSSVAMGIAFTMKQPAVFLVFLGFLLLAYDHLGLKKKTLKQFLVSAGIYGAGAALPLLLIALYATAHGEWDLFVRWNYTYPRVYGNFVSFKEGMEMLRDIFPTIVGGFWHVYVLAALGLGLFFVSKPDKRTLFFVVLFLVFSFLAVTPGLFFRHHYFLMFLPPVTILAALSIDYLRARVPTKFAIAVALVALSLAGVYGLAKNRNYYFIETPANICNQIYFGNFFAEAPALSKFIEGKTTADDKIAVLGSEAEIYFYTKRKAATGYIFTYALIQEHPYNLIMQKEMLSQIEANKPKVIVYAESLQSWSANPKAPEILSPWIERYFQDYDLLGMVDKSDPNRTLSLWENDAKTYQRPPNQMVNAITVYVRR